MAQQLHFEKHLLGGSSQSLKLAFILDPLADLKAWKDSSVAMMRAAENHGHEVYAINAATLGWRNPDHSHAGGVSGEALHLRLRPDDHDWFRELGCEIRPLTDFDAVIMRKDPPFDMNFIYATYLLERAESEGVLVVNKPQSLRDCNEKLFATAFADCMVPTIVTSRSAELRAFIAEHHDVIVKPLDGMGGTGIFRLTAGGPNIGATLEVLTNQFPAKLLWPGSFAIYDRDHIK